MNNDKNARNKEASTMSQRAVARATLLFTAVALLLSRMGHADDRSSRNVAPTGMQTGFIVSSIAFGMGPDADNPGVCPDGMSKGVIEAYKAAGGKDADPRANEQPLASEIRIYQTAAMAPNGENLCANPRAAPDPFFRTVNAKHLPVEGIDLDGQRSHREGKAMPGTCSHDDFDGVDNQMYRVLGCIHGYQSTGVANKFETEMLTGAWAILVSLEGVHDLQNDPDVAVGLYASADPIQLSPTRQPLWHATYSADPDPRFRATTRGRIINGVLTTDPVDVRFRWSAEGWRLVRPLLGARLQLKLASDGTADGFLAGYTPIDEWFANNYNYSSAATFDGSPIRPGHQIFSSVGTARLQGFTCNGLYQAMMQLADGNRDAQSGKCTSISTQYRIHLVPAFVVTQ